MRRKPVSRDEVRFNGWRITTMPVDSVSEADGPIPHLWAPLLRVLNGQRRGAEPIRVPRPYYFVAFSSNRRRTGAAALHNDNKCGGLDLLGTGLVSFPSVDFQGKNARRPALLGKSSSA
jgi:hypothetical protein